MADEGAFWLIFQIVRQCCWVFICLWVITGKESTTPFRRLAVCLCSSCIGLVLSHANINGKFYMCKGIAVDLEKSFLIPGVNSRVGWPFVGSKKKNLDQRWNAREVYCSSLASGLAVTRLFEPVNRGPSKLPVLHETLYQCFAVLHFDLVI